MFHESIIAPILEIFGSVFNFPKDIFYLPVFYLTSQELQRVLLPMKVGFLALSLFFLGFIIFALIKTEWLKMAYLETMVEFFTYKPYGLKRSTKDWQKISQRLETTSESEYKLAVIEADNLLGETLKRLGYAGDTLEDKLLKIGSSVIANVQDVISAHKTRNSIVHDPDYKLGLEEARKILEVYEKSLKDMEAI